MSKVIFQTSKQVASRKKRFEKISELCNAGLSKSTLEKLADAGAFRSIGFDR